MTATLRQNASLAQLKMLMTRIGNGSKLCVLGDGSQPDRPVGANWAAGPGGTTSSIELLASFIEDGDFARANVDPLASARFVVARLTVCRRSQAAAAAGPANCANFSAPRRPEFARMRGFPHFTKFSYARKFIYAFCEICAIDGICEIDEIYVRA